MAAVPGGSTVALDTASNLLEIALLNLRRQGAIALRQLRPLADESVTVLGGRSFAGVQLLRPDARLRGLEGALLDAARKLGDDDGVRRLVSHLDLHPRAPWTTVTNHCLSEAHAAGLVAVEGRLRRRVVVTDVAALDLLQPRHAELRTQRRTAHAAEPGLVAAVHADCLKALWFAHNTD